MEAVAGGRLSLPCDITSPIVDDEVYLVLWYKDEVATPIYSLDARRGPLGQARHATNEPLTGRAYFSSIPQPAVLQIDKVSLEDEGLYRCRVDFRKARTQHSALIVSVAVPPGVPIIKDYNGKMLSGIIGPFNEGDSLHLICEAEGGKPIPSLVWWRSRRIIDDSYEVLDHGITRNELFIEKLQRRDLMATLTCQTTNNKISPPLEASVTLDIHCK
ncbi:nephrin [Nephila pilipes]|uniref:Nephrin n=1 Tax=Nephila pilipes TaxID=299642 RepID=A0A8X6P692_NEPPI|nr:nephrin [Nephila pilipes]